MFNINMEFEYRRSLLSGAWGSTANRCQPASSLKCAAALIPVVSSKTCSSFILSKREVQAQTKNLVYAESEGCGVASSSPSTSN